MHIEEIIGIGSTTYANGKTATYDLSTIPQQINFGDKAAYLYRLTIQAQILISNTSGGTVTIGKVKLYDFLQQCALVTPEFQFINLLNSAGVSLMVDSYMRKLKFPEVFADTAITNGNTGTFNVTLFIDFYDPRAGVSAEDELILCELLRDSKLLLVWNNCEAAGGTYGTNVNATAASSFTVMAELVARDEVRLPVLWHLEEYQAQAMKASIPQNGVFFTDLAIEAVQAAGQATTAFSTTDITQLTQVTVDGVDVVKNAGPGLAVSNWNEQVYGNADRLPQFQAGTCWLVPLIHLKRSSGKRTKLNLVRGNPSYVLAGSLSSPAQNLRFFMRWLSPLGTSYAQKALTRLGIWDKLGANPLAALTSKASGKPIGVDESTKAMVVPILVKGRVKDLIKAA